MSEENNKRPRIFQIGVSRLGDGSIIGSPSPAEVIESGEPPQETNRSSEPKAPGTDTEGEGSKQ
jgi:hypothetical protein